MLACARPQVRMMTTYYDEHGLGIQTWDSPSRWFYHELGPIRTAENISKMGLIGSKPFQPSEFIDGEDLACIRSKR